MITYFFSVKKQYDSSSIELLYAEFGNNIPLYLLLEGGQGLNYLFCLHMDKQKIEEICEKHKYEINGSWYGNGFIEVEISDDLYNNNYQAMISYSNGANYVLEYR